MASKAPPKDAKIRRSKTAFLKKSSKKLSLQHATTPSLRAKRGNPSSARHY
jgi:hypothetical protein